MKDFILIFIIIALVLSLWKTEENFKELCNSNNWKYISALSFEWQYWECILNYKIIITYEKI